MHKKIILDRILNSCDERHLSLVISGNVAFHFDLFPPGKRPWLEGTSVMAACVSGLGEVS